MRGCRVPNIACAFSNEVASFNVEIGLESLGYLRSQSAHFRNSEGQFRPPLENNTLNLFHKCLWYDGVVCDIKLSSGERLYMDIYVYDE